jgi:GT2 family glycosyltransferase
VETIKATIGVVILDFNQNEITRRCLHSIAHGSHVPDVVLLVENGGRSVYDQNDGSFAPLKIIKLHPDHNLGCAGGRNLGISYLMKESSVTTLVVLDNDTVVPYDFIKQLMFLQIEALDVVAPVILDLRTGSVWSCGGRVARDGSVRQLTCDEIRNHREYEVDWAPGACLIMTRQIWKAVGEFDNWMNFLFEDIEWCFRLKKLGGRVIIHTDLRLFHEANQSLDGKWSPARVRFWARNGTLFRLNTVRPYPLASLKWVGNETILAARDLWNKKVTWSFARLSGLAEGLCESIYRRVRERV